MKREDEKILAKTKEDLEKEVKTKLKIKKIKKNTTIYASNIIKENFVSNIIKNIEKYKKDTAKKFGVLESEIKMKMENYTRYISFYCYRKETNEEFKKRCRRSLSQRLYRLKIKQEEIKFNKKCKRKIAIKAIEELGDDIYEVFQEINKRRDETN